MYLASDCIIHIEGCVVNIKDQSVSRMETVGRRVFVVLRNFKQTDTVVLKCIRNGIANCTSLSSSSHHVVLFVPWSSSLSFRLECC